MTTYLSIRLPQISDALMPSLERAFLHAIALAVVEALPEDQLSAFEHALSKGDENEIISFIETHVPHARERLRAAANEFLGPVSALS